MNRQRLILAILLVLLAITVGYSVIRFPHQEKASLHPVTPGAISSGAKLKVSAGQESRLRLDLLQKNQVGFSGFKKNIFAPIFRDLSKLPPVKPVIAPPPPPPPPPPVVAQPTVSPMERELAQFTFLGLLEKEHKKTVFLSKNKEIFLVKKGDRIAGKYEAVAITDDALTIRMLGGDASEIVVPLLDNQTLKPSLQQENGASPQSQPVPRSRRTERNVSPRSPGTGPPVTEMIE
jgi:hypothetical protein